MRPVVDQKSTSLIRRIKGFGGTTRDSGIVDFGAGGKMAYG